MIDKATTYPGFHKQFMIDRFGPGERSILHHLAQDWYLTNSGTEVQAAQSRYNYFLMKPNHRLTEMFNIEREVICIFSDYPNFEPRSLDMFGRVVDLLPNMRTETVCGILISRAVNVEEKVDKLLKSDPEHIIVVPFTYDELLKPSTAALVENRFRKHFFSRDLFSFLSPLKKDTYFFGRGPLINEITNRFKSGEHTGLFGLRKSGKTSIVYAIERRLNASQEASLSLDCESPSIHVLRWHELLQRLVKKYAVLRKSKVSLNDTAYTEKDAADRFEQEILAVYGSKKASSTLFIFDEIERLTPGTASSEHWKNGNDFIFFWQTLRGFYQRKPEVFTYMLVGTNPNCVELPMLNGHENPIYASIPSQYVPAFSVEQVTQMVSKLGDYMGLKFDPLITAKLTEDFGGHPFLIRQVCSVINQRASLNRPFKVDKTLYTKAKEEFYSTSQEYLEMMLNVLRDWYPDEYDMLRLLAQGDEATFSVFARDHYSYTRHLIGYGLIQKDGDGYSFNLEMIAELLRKKHEYERLNLTQTEKLQEISTRRVRMEQQLRFVVRSSLRLALGVKKGAEAVLAAVPEQRRANLHTLTLSQLLDREKSPLFLLELVNIIKREWATLENVFSGYDKAKLVFMLEEINSRGRPEAHAKGISEDDFTQMRLYLKQIDGILSDWTE